MTTPNKSEASDEISPRAQHRKVGRLLLRLQGLLLLVIVAGLVWLYVHQQRFEQQILDRVQHAEQVTTRLNEMDDKLYAISQQQLPEPITRSSDQAQNQLQLLKIQLQAVQRLIDDSDEAAAIELLRGLHWQLSQTGNEIAPALSIVIKQSLMEDTARLQAQSAQPGAWQLARVAIQNMQAFLHRYESRDDKTKNEPPNQLRAATVTHRQLIIHEVIMTLNLAIQANHAHQSADYVRYLKQARRQLVPIIEQQTNQQNNQHDDAQDKQTGASPTDRQSISSLNQVGTPTSIKEVAQWLDRLIDHPPKAQTLLTAQVLDDATNQP